MWQNLLTQFISPKIYLKIERHSHQYYDRYYGEFICGTTAVSYYADDKKIMQVPAIIVKTDENIRIVKLEEYLYHCDVTIISKNEYKKFIKG